MTRRVLGAILGVVTLAVFVFAVPLAVGARRVYRDEARTRVERSAQAAAASLAAQLARRGTGPVELNDDDGLELAAYAADGRLLDGVGPAPPDATVSAALAGSIRDSTTGGSIVVAVPVHDEEDVIGAVRASVPTRVADARARRAWLAMGILALAVLAVAAGIGAVLARRITRPVTTLAAAARRLGDGDFTVRPAPSGIAELDDVADALAMTAHRIGSTLDRERAFSADASHQLRTPLTAMKIRLEAATLDPSADRDTAIARALDEIDRLERTVTELLSLAREHAAPGALDLGNVLDEVEQRWHGTLAASGRPLRIRADHGLPAVAATPEALRHALDVLLDNAHTHGHGAVDVTARTSGTAVAIDVADEGSGPAQSQADLFQRRNPNAAGTGIGLAMARSLIEAEGGRLAGAPGSSCFTILLRQAGEGTELGPVRRA